MNHSTDSFVLHKTTLKCLQGGGWLYSKHRALVTPAGRGKCGKPKAMETEQADDQTPAERRAAMTGFCSCKTGIHAIHGNNLGATPQACIQHWRRDLPGLRGHPQGDCLHRRSDGYPEDTCPSGCEEPNGDGSWSIAGTQNTAQASLFDSTFPVQMLFPKRMRQVFSRSSHRNWPGYGLHSPQTQQNSAAYPPYQDAYQSEASLSILWIQWNGRLYFLYAYDFTDIRITVFV